MTLRAHLEEKFRTYLALIPQAQDKHGFVQTEECDALLFSALAGAAGARVNIEAARDSDGLWHRRPGCDCYPHRSKSTISRDMLLGLAWYCWARKRLDVAEQVIQYALGHWLVMGKGDVSRTLMSPALLSTFAWISFRLGGSSRAWLRHLPSFQSHGLTGYEAHLQVLHIVLRTRLTWQRSRREQAILEAHAARQPFNPLFQYAAGQPLRAFMSLLNDKWWPADRLPTSRDRSEPWLPQRDAGPDWEPSAGEHRVHSGGDLLFVTALLLGRI